ncbi:MAG: SAM-dependent chlorinase/fluorinase [Planctomycetes bacterium]|nr:SAM-dependent chlorinase/fluorinase [Planctomycetota bacterium]
MTLLSDFGSRDPYVGIMKGALLRRCRAATIVDLCHEVPPQDVEVGAFFLGAAVGRFPAGTVHVAVVDPGVGTGRRMLAVAAADCYWIGPDNGLLSAVLVEEDAVVLEVEPQRLGLRPQGRTFHGRDVFAPAGGMLAGRLCGFEALGRRIEDPKLLPLDARPRVVHVDHFGNLITNLAADRLPAGVRSLSIAGRAVPFVGTYGERPAGSLIALVGSFGTVEVAVVDGSAYERLGVGRGEPVRASTDHADSNP